MYVQECADRVCEAIEAGISEVCKAIGAPPVAFKRHAPVKLAVSEMVWETVAAELDRELVRRQELATGDLQRLAWAVIAGEEEAALALADAVQEQTALVRAMAPAAGRKAFPDWVAALPARARRMVGRTKARNFSSLVAMRRSDLENVRGCGEKTADVIARALADVGLSLAPG